MSSDISSLDYTIRPGQWLIGGQMLFVAFGALVLVPLLTGLDPNVALFTAGAGTLIFQAVTRGKVPVFLASSFAFIAPIIYGVQTWGIPATLSGLAAAGLLYVVLSFVVRIKGSEFLERYLPRVVTGPVIMVIGLILAPVGVNLALGKSGDGAIELVPEGTAILLAAIALGTTVLLALLGRGLLRVVPILTGAAVGYLAAILLALFQEAPIVDFSAVAEAPWFAVPSFVFPEWSWAAVVFIVPVALAPAIEHFGDILAIRGVTGRDYLKDPGIQNTMLGDGLATSMASLLGGPPNTTYSEVTGAVTLTRAFNPAIMTWAAMWAIALSFIGKLGAVLQTIPTPVMGGILVLLFGAITVVGLSSLMGAKEDLTRPRNLIIISMILVLGIGGMEVPIGNFALGGIGLAGVVGVLLNLILPRGEEEPANADTAPR
ncbi:MAG: uracil-xanthine permease family protein, partial [Kiloniellales bacterium]|nr:uracil-xanthine permease family protein [Kiloniellales bacterium]